MTTRSPQGNIENDKVIRHFILAGIFVFDLILKFINLIISAQNSDSKDQANSYKSEKSLLKDKSDQELRESLRGFEILSSFSRDQLIDLYIKNPAILKQLKEKERRTYLMKLKNQELRSMLGGAKILIKYRKQELVDLIISQNN